MKEKSFCSHSRILTKTCAETCILSLKLQNFSGENVVIHDSDNQMFVVNVTKSIIFHVYSRVKMLPKPRQSQALRLDLFPEIPVGVRIDFA